MKRSKKLRVNKWDEEEHNNLMLLVFSQGEHNASGNG
jgi:hypothetical protein